MFVTLANSANEVNVYFSPPGWGIEGYISRSVGDYAVALKFAE